MSTDRQIELLESIYNTLNGTLGFGPSPYPVKVYCNRTNGGVWYTLQDSNVQPIVQESLTGYLQQIRFEKVTRRDKEVSKLHIEIDADRKYILEAGSESQFSRTFLNCCSQFDVGVLHNKLVSIVPAPSQEDDSVLFCRLFVDGKSVRTENNPPTSDSDAWRQIAHKAKEAVNAPF